MKEVLKESGFQVDGNKVTIPEGMEDRKVEYLEKVNQFLERQEGVVSAFFPSETFDEQITDAEEKEQDGPRLTKTLGEMPNSRAAFSNWMNLGLFLVIDVVAIIVGIYLLIR